MNRERVNGLLTLLAQEGIYVMPVNCSYCDTVYNVKDGRGKWGVSDGICESCMVKAEKELREGINP